MFNAGSHNDQDMPDSDKTTTCSELKKKTDTKVVGTVRRLLVTSKSKL